MVLNKWLAFLSSHWLSILMQLLHFCRWHFKILHRFLQQLEDLLKGREWKSLDIILRDILPVINFTLCINKLLPGGENGDGLKTGYDLKQYTVVSCWSVDGRIVINTQTEGRLMVFWIHRILFAWCKSNPIYPGDTEWIGLNFSNISNFLACNPQPLGLAALMVREGYSFQNWPTVIHAEIWLTHAETAHLFPILMT